MSNSPNDAVPTYVDRVEIDEVFADGLERITLDYGVCRLEFAVHRRDDQGRIWAYTAARLALSPQGVNDMIAKLERLQQALRAQQPRSAPAETSDEAPPSEVMN